MEPKCSRALRTWAESPNWESEQDNDLLRDFLHEARKAGIKREFVKELVDLQVAEVRANSSLDDRSKLIRSFHRQVDSFFDAP